VALRYQPSTRLTLRAAGSTGFRAPGLGQSHFSHVNTNVIGGVVTDVLISPVADSAARLLGSKPLKEETSVNLSTGFAWSPTENVTVTADYFRITIDDRILLGATFDDSVTLAILTAGGFTNVGGIQYFTNGLDTRTQGVDVTASVRAPAGAGVFDLTGAFNYASNKITRVDPLPAVLGTTPTTETGIIDSVTYIGITEERPNWRATVTAQYALGRFQGLVRGSYYGEFSSAQPGFCDLCRERYGAKTLLDAEVGYRFGQVNVAVGVRNLFDTYPDQPTSTVDVGGGVPAKDYNGNTGTFPWAAASPFGYNGRYLYTRASIALTR
jgi:iron complex outermembrane receptor protein